MVLAIAMSCPLATNHSHDSIANTRARSCAHLFNVQKAKCTRAVEVFLLYRFGRIALIAESWFYHTARLARIERT